MSKIAAAFRLLPALIISLLCVSNFPQESLPSPEQMEIEFLTWINRERESRGLSLLTTDPVLQQVARRHSEDMAKSGILSHSFPGSPLLDQRLKDAGLFFLGSSENVAHSETPLTEFIHKRFMESWTHRINILDSRMTHIGIGVFKKGNDYYITQEFVILIHPPSEAEVMAMLEEKIIKAYSDLWKESITIEKKGRLTARVISQQKLFGNPFQVDISSQLGRIRVVTVSFNKLEQIETELCNEIASGGFQAFTVGAVWGRSQRFPGGTWSVSLLMFLK